ncbi:MAG: DUF3021 domain-containing protein [Lachnospiraceae bacterium]|nr:DUF3021 domain-containing protein [Lachnospiraceae bacterium]
MTKLKLIFNQTLMIASAILFGLGVQEAVDYLITGDAYLRWQWFIPLSIILCAFICSVPSIIFMDDISTGRTFKLKVVLHFLCIFAAVSLFATLFGWYEKLSEYLIIAGMIFIIYGFTWAATFWLAKKDEEKINEALDDMRDEE